MNEQVQSTTFLGKRLIYYPEVESTNKIAKELVSKNEPNHGTVILTGYQSKGRGQASNLWDSAPGKNLLMSLILQPENLQVQHQFYYNMLISISIAELLQTEIPKTIQIKWPNDVLIDGRKTCGILIENHLRGNFIQNLIIGIGMNVNQIHFHSTLTKVTSMKLEQGFDFNVREILEKLLLNIESWLLKFNHRDFGDIRRAYHAKLYRHQEEGEYRAEGGQFTGEIIGVNEKGQLQIKIGNQLKNFSNKEIEFL